MLIIILVIIGAICAGIASGKGRSAVGWFFIGFLFGLIGLIIALVVSDLKAEEEKHRRLERDNHRLREQVRKERMVANQRHTEVKRRLAAHDRVLDLDTSPRGQEDALLEHDDERDLDADAADEIKPPRRASRPRVEEEDDDLPPRTPRRQREVDTGDDDDLPPRTPRPARKQPTPTQIPRPRRHADDE